MSRKTVQRFVAAGVLATVFALAGPARAEARELRGSAPVWQWLTALWESSVSALWPLSPADATEKAGFGTDPNGNPLPSAGASSGDGYDLMPRTDPNG